MKYCILTNIMNGTLLIICFVLLTQNQRILNYFAATKPFSVQTLFVILPPLVPLLLL